MTSDLALIALGVITQATTFVIGVLVGRTISRRYQDHGNSNSDTTEELPTRWRHDTDEHAEAGTRRRGTGGADTIAETGAYERAARRWHTHRD